MSGGTFALLEMLLTFGLVFAFCGYELWSLKKERQKREREAAEEERNKIY